MLRSLRQLGENLAVARVRRRESQREWAKRLGVSVPTLIRMERGEATVSMGTYASALWLMGRIGSLADVAGPQHDLGALEQDVRQAKKRVRSSHSIRGRLDQGSDYDQEG